MKKKVMCLILAASVALCLMGCGKADGDEMETLQYGEIALESDSAGDAFNEYMEKFLAQYGDLSDGNDYKTDDWEILELDVTEEHANSAVAYVKYAIKYSFGVLEAGADIGGTGDYEGYTICERRLTAVKIGGTWKVMWDIYWD